MTEATVWRLRFHAVAATIALRRACQDCASGRGYVSCDECHMDCMKRSAREGLKEAIDNYDKEKNQDDKRKVQ